MRFNINISRYFDSKQIEIISMIRKFHYLYGILFILFSVVLFFIGSPLTFVVIKFLLGLVLIAYHYSNKKSFDIEFALLIAITLEICAFSLFSYNRYPASIFWLLLAPNYILLLKKSSLKNFFIILIVCTIIFIPIINFLLDINYLPSVTNQGFDIITVITALFLLLINYLLIDEYINIYTKENTELTIKNKKLQETKSALLESRNFQERFYANVSHELRTPLSTITGISDLLKTKNIEPDLSNSLYEASRSLNLLIDDFLEFNKIREGKILIQKKPYNLRENLDKISKVLNFQLTQKNIQLLLSISDSCPEYIIGDAKRLNQILINIIGNNIIFNNNGSISLKVSPQSIDNEVVQLHFDIAFHFSGIEGKKNNSESRYLEYDGSSQPILGLELTEKIIESKNGKIDIKKNNQNQYSFHLTLDYEIHNPNKSQSLNTLPKSYNTDLNTKIMIVDDNKINLTITKKQIELHQPEWQINTQDNGEEALLNILNTDYDTIILDVRMPKISGIEMAEIIRSQSGPNQNKPIIALTADVTEKTTQECLDVGMNTVLSKPYDINDLINTISQYSPYEK